MSETPTAEQLEVRRKGRQRLIGAVAIVLLAVVFVPMVLDPEPNRERKEPALTIPSKDAVAPLPAPTPAKAAAEAPKAAETKPAETKPVEAPKPAPATAAVKPVESKVLNSKPSSIPAPAPASVAAAAPPPAAPVAAAAPPAVAPKLEGFAVQVGAFGDEEKLKQARAKLAAAKITHFTERIPSSGLTRLRAGPYPTREAAEKAQVAVAAAGLEGKVVPLP
ncbi:SPOR domain-containing protein [Usitatibacter palustris]|uniref:SPOR domain-containing protein n=1 Tax=Usitatibacter palustris TaxID=2732487 RepID=A0A6M4H5V5_9PROT|nr:SPOR domain-containing protein [Usitatibacter palustris]QJR14682.1 hypothetical protein DSM104440_01492 [Usitatibacter palustris]